MGAGCTRAAEEPHAQHAVYANAVLKAESNYTIQIVKDSALNRYVFKILSGAEHPYDLGWIRDLTRSRIWEIGGSNMRQWLRSLRTQDGLDMCEVCCKYASRHCCNDGCDPYGLRNIRLARLPVSHIQPLLTSARHEFVQNREPQRPKPQFVPLFAVGSLGNPSCTRAACAIPISVLQELLRYSYLDGTGISILVRNEAGRTAKEEMQHIAASTSPTVKGRMDALNVQLFQTHENQMMYYAQRVFQAFRSVNGIIFTPPVALLCCEHLLQSFNYEMFVQRHRKGES